MGIAQAGVAFRPVGPIHDIQTFLSELFNEDATAILHPDQGQFDIRNHGDVMVQFFDDVCFICNNDLVWNILENPHADMGRLHRLLGAPEFMMAFCHYDSGGSYGYAVAQHGERVRTRLQVIDDLQPLLESGEPMAFELPWLSAPYYMEEEEDEPPEDWIKVYYQGDREILVSEDELTPRILAEGLQSIFGVCPWETDATPTFHFFTLLPKKQS